MSNCSVIRVRQENLNQVYLTRWTLKYLNMAVRSKQCSKTKNYKDDLPFVCVISIFSIFVENTELKELFLLETSLLSKYQQANIHILFEPSSDPHTKHTGELS